MTRAAAALALLLVGAAAGAPARAQMPDSLSVAGAPADTLAPPSPGLAVRRALLVPGWGQLTNGQRIKAPIAAGAVVGAVAYAVVRQRQYTRYRRAALFAGCQASPDREVCADVSSAEDEWIGLGSPAFSAVSPVRDRVRGQRDVAFLLAGVVYALQALDAYVAAELAGFDVTDDLSLRVAPSPGGASLTARWRW